MIADRKLKVTSATNVKMRAKTREEQLAELREEALAEIGEEWREEALDGLREEFSAEVRDGMLELSELRLQKWQFEDLEERRATVETRAVEVEEVAANVDKQVAEAQARLDAQANQPTENKLALVRMRAQRAARELLDEENDHGATLPTIYTMRELIAQPQPDEIWTIERLLSREGNGLLVAPQKIGKTTLALNILRSLVCDETTGNDFADDGAGSFLGEFAVNFDGAVALLNYELSDHMMARWGKDVGIDSDRLHVLNLRSSPFDFTTRLGREALASECRARGVKFLIVDPWQHAFKGDNSNDDTQQNRALEKVNELKAAADIPDALVIHHTGWEGTRSRGSSALEGWPDAIWRISDFSGSRSHSNEDREDEQRTRYFEANGRDVDEPKRKLIYDPNTRRLTLGDTAAAAYRSKRSELRVEVLAAVKANPGTWRNDLARKLDTSDLHAIDAALAALLKAGEITSKPKGQRTLYSATDAKTDARTGAT